MGKCQGCGCNHQVVVYKEGCSYRAEPGRLVIHRGATVTFFSLVQSDGPVELWFPKGAAETSLRIQLGYQKPTPVPVGNECGVFAYAVHVPGAQRSDFAEGGSPPRMIVADP